MNILIFLIVELLSVIISSSIIINERINTIIEISKKGYKFDKNIIDSYQNGQIKEDKTTSYKLKTLINTILLLIPGVNMVSAILRSIVARKKAFKEFKVTNSLVPMSEEEKEDYSKLESKKQKILFAAFTATKKNDDERIFAFIGDKPLVVDKNLTSIYRESLPNFAYSYEEVKKLNSAITGTFRVGYVDGRCTAIIGIPDKDYQLKRISFRNESWENIYDFIEMTEDVAKKKTYIVYPYFIPNDVNLDNIVNDIVESRRNISKNNTTNNYQKTELIVANSYEQKPKILSLR